MVLLDENIRAEQAESLSNARVPTRKIGKDLAVKGTGDADIIPLLLKQKSPTFFTHDKDFWKSSLRHDGYCLAYLDVPAREAAEYIRRFLRHPFFNTSAKRLGKVIHIHPDGITYFAKGSRKVHAVAW
jgi:predicted nuclease of predicted toxin-antitoxin system